jgi:hypothetical protein
MFMLFMVNKLHLYPSIYLFGLETILTILMLIYLSKNDMVQTSKNNIYDNVMLAASKMQ